MHNVEHWVISSTPWHKINQHLPSKHISARGGKVYPYNGFLNFFLRIFAIDIVVLIDVVDLSLQIFEFGKDRDDGYCKVLI